MTNEKTTITSEEVLRRQNLSSTEILTIIWIRLEEINNRLIEIERQLEPKPSRVVKA